MTAIPNFRLGVVIEFNDILHGFCTGRGMGIAFLEAKILQHLAVISEEVLYNIFFIYISPTIA